MIPFTVKVPVRSDAVFPKGALWMGVDAQTDFDLRGKVDDDQARDKHSGERVWLVTVIDLEEPDETTRFRRTAEHKVRVIAPYRPVPPAPTVPGYPPVIAFEGLTMTPWVDQTRCHPGGSDSCRARLAYSLRATGVIAFTDEAVAVA